MRNLSLVALALLAAPAPGQKSLQAWHTAGQTFLVWEHSTLIPPLTYDVHASTTPITRATPATWIGRLFADNGANTRIRSYVSGARWILPGPGSATTRVGARQAYFVSTPRAAGRRYFAVVATGATTVTTSTGPVTETITPVTCHLQHRDANGAIWAHWIDGRFDHTKNRADYPVMGNHWENGHGFNFVVWEPRGLRRPAVPAKLPAVVMLHGGGGNLIQVGPVSPGTGAEKFGHPTQALTIALDDPVRALVGRRLKLPSFTFWLGHWRGFNRFAQSNPPDGAVVVDYTRRRALWEIAWVRDNLGVDGDRISLTGISMGGIGSALFAHTAPELFAAAAPYVAPFELDKIVSANAAVKQFGTKAQGLRVDVPGRPKALDYLNPAWRSHNLPGRDWPHVRWVFGRNDERVAWSLIAPALPVLNASRRGEAVYWDDRKHSDWRGSHFEKATRIRAPYLTAYRRNGSWPGLFDVDTDPQRSGRQPDPGNGSAGSGSRVGTWGGYVHWDPALVVESATMWECELRIITDRADASEITTLQVIEASVSPRRRTYFRPRPSTRVAWELRQRSDGQVLQRGTVTVAAGGEIVVPKVRIVRAPAVLRLFTGRGRAPLHTEVTQPRGPGSLRIAQRGMRPGTVYANFLRVGPAPDGIGTGWLLGMQMTPAMLALTATAAPPFVGVADSGGGAVFELAGGLSPLELELLTVEIDATVPGFFGSSSGILLSRLR